MSRVQHLSTDYECGANFNSVTPTEVAIRARIRREPTRAREMSDGRETPERKLEIRIPIEDHKIDIVDTFPFSKVVSLFLPLI